MNYDEKFYLLNSILYEYKEQFNIIDFDLFIDALINASNVSKYLGIPDYKLSKQVKLIWPSRPKGKLLNFVLGLAEYKNCTKCLNYLPRTYFRLNKYNSDGLNPFCKGCHSYTTGITQANRQANYRAAKLKRTPAWADLDKIKEFYDNCPRGYHVDHIVPLQGEHISGLHIETNLQYLPAIDNIKKGNKFNPE